MIKTDKHTGVEKKPGKKKSRTGNLKIGLIFLACVLLCYFIILSAVMPKKYDIKPGEKSEYDIVAPRDTVNMVLTRERAEEMREQVQPVIVRTDISAKQLNIVADIFVAVKNLRSNMLSSVLLQNFVIPGFQEGSIRKGDVPHGIPIFSKERKFLDESLTAGNKILLNYNINTSAVAAEDIYIYASDAQIGMLEKSIRDILVYIFENDIFEDNLDTFLEFAEARLSMVNISENLKNMGNDIFTFVIKPNCVIDSEHTRALKEQAYTNVMQNNKVVVNANDRIISVGDIVTNDKYAMLEDLNMIKDGKTNYTFFVAVFLITLILSMVFISEYNVSSDNKADSSGILLIASVVILVLLIARLTPSGYFYFIPIFTGVMLLAILTDDKVAFIGNAVLTLFISFMYNWNIPFMVMSLCVGSFTIFLLKKLKKRRSGISLCGVLAGVLNVFVIFAFSLFYGWTWKEIGIRSAMVFLSGLFSGIITIGILPVIEMAFDVMTPIKLLELVNPNHDLLKRLLMEAPGTYHHSLMVGNLAENAARTVGGNPLLARVGAYYHDIGKLKRPNFFIENQHRGNNPHDKLNPSLSKMIITEHVKHGLELCKKYKLPSFISDFIVQHHGTTLVAYFYHKAVEGSKNVEIDQQSFRYDGVKPTTKESAVVMLADSVEAAIKSMDLDDDLTEGKIRGIIKNIIDSKYEDDQLENCDITLKDLTNIREGFIKVYSGYFHGRVKYPKSSDFEDQDKELIKKENGNGR